MNMQLNPSIKLSVSLLLACVGLCATLRAGEILERPAVMTDALLAEAMPKHTNSELGRLLNRYYRNGVGTPEAWEQLNSLRMSGTMEREAGNYELEEWQKKPFLWRQELRAEGAVKLRGFDGEIAWKRFNPEEPAEAYSGVRGQAIGLNATLGSHLLYPFEAGKQIELVETLPVKGRIWHRIRVTFEANPMVVEYMIEVPGYRERKRSYLTDEGEELFAAEWSAYKSVAGIQVPYKRVYYRHEAVAATVQLDFAKPNCGLVPWMFRIPE